MMETEILYRLSFLMGFLVAGFLAVLVGAIAVGLRCWCKSAKRELENLMDHMEETDETKHA